MMALYSHMLKDNNIRDPSKKYLLIATVTENKMSKRKDKQGGSFNLINSYLGHSSLFTFTASEDCKIVKLHSSDLVTISKTRMELYGELELLKAKHL